MARHHLSALVLSLVVVGCTQGPPEEEELNCARDDFCEESDRRFGESVDAIVETMNTCETAEDCSAQVPQLGCDASATWLTSCAKGVRSDQVGAFHAAVDDLEGQYCTDCDLECHHSDLQTSCTAPLPKCVDGRCDVEFAEDVIPPSDGGS